MRLPSHRRAACAPVKARHWRGQRRRTKLEDAKFTTGAARADQFMPIWMQIALGLILGVGIIVGVFWLTFRRVPERRSDGGLAQHDAANYASFIERDVNGDQHH